MVIHIFNPEHDISLAVNLKRFTLPKAVANLKEMFAFLPMIWADEGDLVLVNDVDKAVTSCSNLLSMSAEGGERKLANVQFVTPEMLVDDELVARISGIDAWGMDAKLATGLLDINPHFASLLPSAEALSELRMTSARFWAANHLMDELLRLPHTVGKVKQFFDYDTLFRSLQSQRNYVVKAPWSSSGRGVRLLEPRWRPAKEAQEGGVEVEIHQENWVKNIIRSQGSIMMEPYLEGKIMDFGVELEAVSGEIKYCGLSIFKAENGAYLGNLLDSELHKRSLLAAHIRLETLDLVMEKLLALLKKHLPLWYNGPLGVDMMVLKDGEIAPMIELNLRRTMGHVAIDLYSRTGKRGWMRLNPSNACVDIINIK
ncbi:hypothetical protein [Prevotella sp.]|uniref:hypothetical protein n=1 Tax=Prevotella sp. TaxID=59823 RepID=UPI002F930A3F